MEDKYIVSALKYRPATFQSVVGQASLTTTLKNAIANNHLAHAYLFCGPRGVGKTTCARIFAKTINCLTPTSDGEACNECESCKGFNEQRSFNIHELDAASNNSVEDIRNLVEQVRIPPQIGKYSVFIIDEVHMLTTAAFNAFLKTLEEPPAHVIFILATTEKHKIIPTILSRCQIYDFNRISVQDTVNHLEYVAQNEKVKVDSEALNVIAQKADGGMRDALSIFDQVVNFCGNTIEYKEVIENLNVLDYDYYFQLLDFCLKGNVPNSLLIFDEILNKGFEGMHFIGGLASHIRNVMVSRDPVTVKLLEVGDAIAEKYKQQATICDETFLYRALEITTHCDQKYKESRNKRLLVEMTLIKLCSILHPVAPVRIESTPIQELVPTSSNVNSIVTQKKTVETTPNTKVVLEETTPTVKEEVKKVVPVETIKQPKRSIHKSTVSLKKAPLLNNHQEKVSKQYDVQKANEVVNEETLGKDPIDEFSMGKVWMQFAHTIKSEAYTCQILRSNIPQIVGDSILKLELQNDIQIDRLKPHKKSIEKFLAQSLNHNGIKLELVIDPNASQQKSLTPEENLVALEKEYPDFGSFVDKMALRL